MSTYYYVGCKQCETYTRFVGRWFPSHWSWLPNDDEEMRDIPAFVSQHENHITEMCIISEYDLDGAFDHWTRYPTDTPEAAAPQDSAPTGTAPPAGGTE